MGRSDTHSTARRWERGNLPAYNSFNSDRNLFYCKDKAFTNQNVSGHDKGTDRQKGKQGQPVHVPDTHCLYGDESGHGQSGWCCGCHISGRCCFLDVDNSHYRFIHGFCGGYTGTASQGAGSIVLRLSRRSGVLHTPLL